MCKQIMVSNGATMKLHFLYTITLPHGSDRKQMDLNVIYSSIVLTFIHGGSSEQANLHKHKYCENLGILQKKQMREG